MIDLINQIIMLSATGGIGGFFGWFFARRKQDAEATGSEIENGSKVVELYKNALDDLSHRYEQKYQDIESRSLNIEKLFESKEKLLQQELELLRKQVLLYKKMYDDKVKEFNKYKKEHP
jgi:uncharacterized protein YdiU (UPF0061 family)